MSAVRDGDGHDKRADVPAVADVAGLALVGLLQLADSSFPSGSFTLSGGLETLVADGIVRDVEGIIEVVQVSLASRLALADLPALMGVMTTEPVRVVAIDRRLLTTKLAREERDGACRVGRRLVAEATLVEPSSALLSFQRSIEAAETPGTSAVAFGLAAAAFGVGPREAASAAASGFVMGQALAAVRLALIGHRGAQLVIRGCGAAIVAAVDVAAARDPLDPRPSTPGLDIALARHETAQVRMFAS